MPKSLGLQIARQPIAPGILWVASEDLEVLNHGRIVLEISASSGSRKAGVPFPKSLAVMALHSGPYREFQEFRRVADGIINISDTSAVQRIWVGHEGFNFLSDEGLRAAAMRYFPSAAEPMCASFYQPLSVQPLFRTVAALARMQPELRTMEHLALIFSSWPTAVSDQSMLRGAVDDLVVLERCEAEPHALLSFSISMSGSGLLGRFSAASVMVDAHVVDGRVGYKFSPFISKQLLDRYVWRLRAAGHSLESIATEVNLNKTTVKRRLDKLPPCVRRKAKDGWELAYREALELLEDEEE